MNFTEARRRYEFHKSNRSNIEAVWDMIQRYVLPFRALFYNDKAEEGSINWRRREIYDSTAINVAQSLAATVNANLTNPVVRWFELATNQPWLNKQQEVKAWLEFVADLIFQVFKKSNFNQATGEMYLDLVGFGIGPVLEEVKEAVNGKLESIMFNSVPVDESFFDADQEGKPIRWYRQLRWTPLQIIDKFGYDNVPQFIKDMLESSDKASVRMPILFVVYKRYPTPVVSLTQPLAPNRRPYGAKYFIVEGAMKGEETLHETGYYEMPVFMPRWRTVSGSQYGYSPAMVSLSTILSLNETIRIILGANEKVMDPPIFSTRRGILNDYDLRAGRVTLIQDPNAIKQWEFKGRLDFGFMQMDNMKEQIRQDFFADQFQLKESPAMTAMEVAARWQLMQKLTGPTSGQIAYDFLKPTIGRTYHILLRYGLIPPAPAVLNQSGVALDIEYIGPLAKSQRSDVMYAIERWMMSIAQMSGVFPQSLDIPDVDETVKELGYSAGVPAHIVKSDAAIMAKRMRDQQEQEKVKQLALAEGAGTAMQSLGKGMREVQGGPVRENAQAA